jgi:hypothetical protein
LSAELTTDASDPTGCLIRAFEKTDAQFILDNEVSFLRRHIASTDGAH